MAVFGGARLRTVALPTTTADGAARAAAQRAARTASRLRPTGLLMAFILAATMLGLVYLTQTLGSNATSSEITGLAAQREELGRQLRNLAVAVEAYADPDELGRIARRRGLVELDDVVVLPVP